MKKTLLLATSLFVVSSIFSQYATGDNTSEEEFEKILKAAERATRDLTNLPTSFSIKKYAPIPQNQGIYGTCVAWSSAYAARTISYAIKRNLTNADSLTKYAFSPGYIYYKIKDAGDDDCKKGSSILTAMTVMTSDGAMLKKEGLVDCTLNIPENEATKKAAPYKIKTFLSLVQKRDSITKNEIIKIKKSLSEKKPVVFSLKIDDRFEKLPETGFWSPEDDFIPAGRHAMCIIGYDDKIAGGAFEVINSWSTNWGNKGFFWISYKQMMKYGSYAVELMDYEIGKTTISGDIEFVKLSDTGTDISLGATRKKMTAANTVVKGTQKIDYSLYKLTETLKGGDQFKMKFSTNTPSFIYVFAEDDKEKISRLFPYPANISAAINQPNATYYLPSEFDHARLDMAPGKENFCILYSKSEIDLEGLLTYINDTKINLYQAVKNKLGTRLVDQKKVKFTDDRISFEVPTDDKSILCFFVEMNHK